MSTVGKQHGFEGACLRRKGRYTYVLIPQRRQWFGHLRLEAQGLLYRLRKLGGMRRR